MNPKYLQARRARLRHECEVSVAPAILLLAACSVLLLVQAFGVLTT